MKGDEGRRRRMEDCQSDEVFANKLFGFWIHLELGSIMRDYPGNTF